MRNQILLSLSITCITAFTCLGQYMDPQWFIKDNTKKMCGASTNTSYDSQTQSNSVILSQVMAVNGPTDGARNDIFVIYEDNSYFNSRFINEDEWNSYYVSNPSPINLKLIGSRSIEYLYLTNTYETDDPDACVDDNAIPSFTKTIDTTGNKNIISANHDVGKSKDITLIINPNLIKPTCAVDRYTLCFDTLIDEGGNATSAMTEFHLTESRVFEGSKFVKNGPKGLIIKELCIEDIPITEELEFVNLKVPDTIPRRLKEGYKLLFYIEGCSESRLAESIGDSHDPNFVRVDCVSAVEGKKYAKYTISTENETEHSVGNLSIDFIPPSAWNREPPTIISSTVSDDSGLSATNAEDNSGSINFPFEGVLNGYQTATLTFCLELDNSFNLEKDKLQLSNPRVVYDETPYPIYEFFDINSDQGSVIDTTSKPHVIRHSNITKRPLSSFADCGCGEQKECVFFLGKFCISSISLKYWAAILLLIGIIGITKRKYFLSRWFNISV